jgi:hypothetical protein
VVDAGAPARSQGYGGSRSDAQGFGTSNATVDGPKPRPIRRGRDHEEAPWDLNLLGLRAQLNQVKLDVTAIPGGGLLGDLLCGISNLLNPTGVGGDLLSRILNSLLALVPRTPVAAAP